MTQQTYSLTLNEMDGVESPQSCQTQGYGVDQSQQSFGLSLSQDFALTSSQEDLYRFGEVW